MEEKSFLGRGWSFPPTFIRSTQADFVNGEIAMVESNEDIRQSLEILLSTSLGERVLQAKYGCNLKDFQFEPISVTLLGFIKSMVENAILYYEPRIKLEKVEVSEANTMDAIEGRLFISVTYVIRESNSRFNYVYDFYKKEAIGSLF